MRKPAAPGFPLTAVFLLISVVAVVLALIAATRRGQTEADLDNALGGAGVGFIAGGVVGVVYCLYQSLQRAFVLTTFFACLATGTACGYVVVAGANFWLLLGGSAGLILLAAVAGRSRHAQGQIESPIESPDEDPPGPSPSTSPSTPLAPQ